MTEEERVARGMLLGWTYVPRLGYYLHAHERYENSNMRVRYDANTMEPLTWEEVIRRANNHWMG